MRAVGDHQVEKKKENSWGGNFKHQTLEVGSWSGTEVLSRNTPVALPLTSPPPSRPRWTHMSDHQEQPVQPSLQGGAGSSLRLPGAGWIVGTPGGPTCGALGTGHL